MTIHFPPLLILFDIIPFSFTEQGHIRRGGTDGSAESSKPPAEILSETHIFQALQRNKPNKWDNTGKPAESKEKQEADTL
jgi:hypothetical protein